MTKMPATVIRLLPVLLMTLAACTPRPPVSVYPFSARYGPGETFMDIRLHGALRLERTSADDCVMGGLSGLAWDADEQILYALSDHGCLFHLQVLIRHDTLSDVRLLKSYPLRSAQGDKLTPPLSDAEGLTVRRADNHRRGDSELLISFERQPRIARYTPQGRYLGRISIAPSLRTLENYRNCNKALEAVTLRADGQVLTAPEWSLRGQSKSVITFYGQGGAMRSFPAHTAPNSAVVALEALPDDTLLVMERAFTSPWRPLIISLRQVDRYGQVEDIAILDNTQGWHLDNFEGLTRHRDGYFFMVSDDNFSNTQKTLLVYFEIGRFP